MAMEKNTSQSMRNAHPDIEQTTGGLPLWLLVVMPLYLFSALYKLKRLSDELLDKKAQLESCEGLLQEASDFLRTTSENSNWPSSVMSSPLLASGRKLLEKIDKKLAPQKTAEQQASTEVPGGKANQQPAPEGSEEKAEKKTGSPATTGDAVEDKHPKRPAHHKGVTQEIYQPDEVKDIVPKECHHCHGHDIKLEYSTTYQVLELVLKMFVTHFHVWHGVCRECGHKVSAEVPAEARHGFAPGLTAFIGFLTGLGVTRRKLAELIRQTTGFGISQGGIQNCLDRVSQSITPHFESIMKHTRRSSVNYIDETSSRLFGPAGKEKHWLWIMTSAYLALFMIFEHRSAQAFAELIGPWAGILVSDGYALYLQWGGIARQACLAHLTRRAKKLSESLNPTIARGGRWILVELRRLAKMAHNPPSRGEFSAWRARFFRCVHKYESAGGELGKLCALLKRESKYITTFLRFGGAVEPTNNRAERGLRPFVCRRKISFGCTSRHGEMDIAKLMTLHETCRLNGKSTFTELKKAIEHHDRGKTPSLYWIRKAGMKAARPVA